MTTESITKPVAAPRAEVAVIEQAGSSARAGALRRAHGLRARFRGVGEREGRGYGVWLFVGLVFGVPESWAGITNPLTFWFAKEVPFPTLYRTVADLERRWRPAAIVIVAGLVVLMFHLVFFPWPDNFFRA